MTQGVNNSLQVTQQWSQHHFMQIVRHGNYVTEDRGCRYRKKTGFCSYCFCNYEVALYTISLYAYIFLYYIILTEIQLGVRCCFKRLICINSFNSHDSPMRLIYLWSSFQEHWGIERWGSAPRDTQLVCGGGRIWTQESGSGILLITWNSWFLILIQSFHLICN